MLIKKKKNQLKQHFFHTLLPKERKKPQLLFLDLMLENHCLLFLTNLPWVIQGQTAQFILKILKFKQVLLPVFGLVLKPSSDPPDTVLEYHQQFFKILQNNVHLSFILKVFIQPSLCARHCRFHNERNLIPWAH